MPNKFRGKWIDTKEWIYGYLIGKDVIVGEIVEFEDEYFYTEFWYRVDPATVGQSTDIWDASLIDIYTGDIVRWSALDEEDNWMTTVCTVVFARGQFMVKNKKGIWPELEPLFDFVGTVDDDHRVEVIGNIYDNPELLK